MDNKDTCILLHACINMHLCISSAALMKKITVAKEAERAQDVFAEPVHVRPNQRVSNERHFRIMPANSCLHGDPTPATNYSMKKPRGCADCYAEDVEKHYDSK